MCETAACARFSLEGGEDGDQVVNVYDTKKRGAEGNAAVASMTLPEYAEFLDGIPPTAYELITSERGFRPEEANAVAAWAGLGHLSVKALMLAGPDGVTAKTGDIPTTPFAPNPQIQAAAA